MLNKKLFPFMDADGAGTGAGTQENDPAGEPDKKLDPDDPGGQEGADERKTGDVKSEAQKIADAMLAKKMKGMPSKEELAAFKKWQDEQKTENERLLEAQKAADAANAEASKKEAKANAMIAAVSAGIKTQHIEDAVILAMARVNDDTSIEDAIQTVAKNNPAWVAGLELPGSGGNPAKNEEDKKTPPTMI